MRIALTRLTVYGSDKSSSVSTVSETRSLKHGLVPYKSNPHYLCIDSETKNNNPDNLQTLCPFCDTEVYGTGQAYHTTCKENWDIAKRTILSIAWVTIEKLVLK